MSVKKPRAPVPPEERRAKGFERQIDRMGYGDLKRELNRRKNEEAQATNAKRRAKHKRREAEAARRKREKEEN